ncbi:hypothetical protein AAG570_013497 [Ranatra chinensis]|uniref:Uncharacterized protein n=1 Tax=Ranatra chinensis TaxID=642074 RepID=A0ABD0YYQ4_9HEMI
MELPAPLPQITVTDSSDVLIGDKYTFNISTLKIQSPGLLVSDKIADTASGRDWNAIKSDGGERCVTEGECNMDTFGLIYDYSPFFTPLLKIIKVLLEIVRYKRRFRIRVKDANIVGKCRYDGASGKMTEYLTCDEIVSRRFFAREMLDCICDTRLDEGITEHERQQRKNNLEIRKNNLKIRHNNLLTRLNIVRNREEKLKDKAEQIQLEEDLTMIEEQEMTLREQQMTLREQELDKMEHKMRRVQGED